MQLEVILQEKYRAVEGNFTRKKYSAVEGNFTRKNTAQLKVSSMVHETQVFRRFLRKKSGKHNLIVEKYSVVEGNFISCMVYETQVFRRFCTEYKSLVISRETSLIKDSFSAFYMLSMA